MSTLKLRKIFAAFTLTTLVASLFVVAPATQAAPPSWWTEGTELLDQVDPMYGDVNQVEADKCRVSAVLTAALGLEENPGAAANYTDVPAGCEGVAGAMISSGIIMGEGNDGETFGSYNTTPRVVFTAMLSRAFNLDEVYPNAELSASDAAELADMNAEWASETWAQVRAAGIYQQTRPADTINIYEITTAVSRAMDPNYEPPTENEGTGGDLEITISDNTPQSRTVPGGVQNAHIATFEIEANNDDVNISSIKFAKGGIADDDALTSIALFTEEGQRVSRARTFNSSDDTATVNLLSGGLMVEGGDSMDLLVFGQVGSVDANSALISDQFFVQIKSSADVSSNASSVTVANAKSETMTIGSADAAELELSQGSNTPDVSVGERGVEVFNFEMENNSVDNTDIIFYGITLEAEGTFDEDTDLMNYELYLEGDLVASTEMSKNGYVSFLVDDVDGYVIEDSRTIDAEVRADVMSGANETISFDVDSELDVLAADASFGTGAKIIIPTGGSALSQNTTTIEAGELTLVAIDPENDEFTEDTDEFVLGTIRVTSNAGQNIELQELRVDIVSSLTDVLTDVGGQPATTGAQDEVSDVLENVEAVTPFGTYSLDLTGGTGATETYEDDQLGLLLPAGESFDIVITADILDNLTGLQTSDTLELSLPTINGVEGTSYFYAEEIEDDEAVTDITPSSLSFNSVNGEVANLEITPRSQSANKDAVIGSEGVVAMHFEFEASDSEDITVNDITVDAEWDADGPGGGAAVDATNQQISRFTLYRDEVLEENIIDSQSGSQLQAGTVDFENLDEVVEAGDTVEYFVTIDIVNDDALDGGTINTSITAVDADDSDNDNVDTTGLPAASTRTITVQGAGTLVVTNDEGDEGADISKLVLGGQTSGLVAAYKLVADNEDVLVEDININITDADADSDFDPTAGDQGADNGAASRYIDQVELIAEDGVTVIATESVLTNSNTVEFEDIDYVVSESQSDMLYVRVKAHSIGDEKEGNQSTDFSATGDNLRFAFEVTEAEGASSGNTLTIGGDVTNPAAANENLLGVVSVHILDISLDTTDYGGYQVEDNLTGGRTTLGILKVDTAGFEGVANTFDDSSDTLDMLLQSLAITVDGDGTTTIGAIDMIRLGKGAQLEREVAADGVVAADGNATALPDFSNNLTASEREIEAGQTAYFAIQTQVSNVPASNGFLQLSIEDLDNTGAGLNYSSTDVTPLEPVTQLRIGRNVERGVQIVTID